VTKFQVGIMLTCHTMDGQMHLIGNAIKPFFADPVTFGEILIVSLLYNCFNECPVYQIKHCLHSKISLETKI